MRVLLFAGKGGVGKTSVAAATALRASQLGHHTVAVSLDLAHSLSDSLDLDKRLMDDAGGEAIEVADRFSIQEIDVESELRRYWGGVHDYIAQVLNTAGLDQVVAEEVALLPGMAEVIGLLWLNKYRREQVYDLVVLDCAPTGESLRFLSMPTALEWYMDRVFRLERTLVKVARPFVSAFSDLPVPGDDYFRAIQALYDRLEGVRELLEDPLCTSARVVTNAEKMVVRETRRAFMYIGLYGLNVDLVVANRLLPAGVSDPHFAAWRRTQEECLREIEESFAPVPVRRAPLFDDQVLGMERLDALADAVYVDDDPAAVFREARPWRFEKEGDEYHVMLRLPFVAREDVELSRSDDQLIVRIGGFKRHVTLPGSYARMRPEGAEMQGDELCIRFGRDEQ